MNRACPSPVELTRELSTGANEATAAHLEQCEQCAAEWASLARVTGLAAQLPTPEVPEQRARTVRSALLGAAAASPPARPGVSRALVLATAAAAAIALALGGYLLFRAPAVAEPQDAAAESAVYRAEIHAHAGAIHTVVGAQPDEIVRLTDGMVTFEVATLATGERFRVVTGDAEVEVSGTVFDVRVASDELVAVHVISGEVVVRYSDDEPTVVAAGEWWRRPAGGGPGKRPLEEQPEIATAPAAVETPASAPAPASAPRRAAPRPVVYRAASATTSAPAPETQPAPKPLPTDSPAAPAPAPASAPAPVEHQPSPAQQAFETGWSALRRGDATTAAAEFSKAAGSQEAIAEDAGYWEAVAFARSGQHQRATRALATFIQRHPGSPRAGEASVMLGWSLFHSDNLNGAETRFRAGLDDRSGRVRTSAQKGLQAVERRRQAASP